MKPVYILATALAILLFISDASAQYTAVRSGNWNDVSATTPWDPSGMPPAVCNGCTITINSGFTVTLNTSVTLGQNSILRIGNGGSSATLLLIAPSGGSDFATSNNLILPNNGVGVGTQIKMGNISSVLQAGGTSPFDGVFISYNTVPVTYFKQIGIAPQLFIDQTPSAFGPAAFGTSLTGPVTLSSSGTLPIFLTGFEALMDKSHVELNWRTAVEINSDHFSVQRLDAANSTWETIGKVDAKGNSSSTVQYTFTDESPRSGVNEYRIGSVDRDGKYTFSEIKTVSLGGLDVKIFPNPAMDNVNINLSKTATGLQSIRLLSQSGQLLIEKKVDNAAGTIVSLPVSKYPQGNYLIIVTGPDGSRQVSKLFISRL